MMQRWGAIRSMYYSLRAVSPKSLFVLMYVYFKLTIAYIVGGRHRPTRVYNVKLFQPKK